MRKWHVEWLLVLPLFGACEKDQNTSVQFYSEQAKIVIRNGTSYTECMGYCTGELSVEQSVCSLQRISNNGQKIITHTWKTDPVIWNQLLNKIDTQKLALLSHHIPCTDCKVGDTEWLEIQLNNKVYTINFTLSDTLPALSPLLTELHQLYIQKKQ